MNVLAFDVGGTFIKYGVFNDGRLGRVAKIPTPRTAADFYANLAQVVADQPDLAGIALSFPGFIDTKQQRAIRAGHLFYLDGQAIGQELNRRLVKPLPIWLENDANCAAMAEKLSGNAQDVDDFVVITLGTGVGGGIFVNGRILRGHDYRAGEFGMMLTNVDVDPEGTLHDYASTSALVQHYATHFGMTASSVDGRQIIAEQQEPAVAQLIEDWGQRVATAIFNLVATLDPQRVLLGGGISQNPALLPIVHRALHAIRFWDDFQVPLGTCAHHNDAGLYGAYYAIMTERFGKY
ncbi:ROK family protein [Schleiferilactobacillus harbinensis]|jgi:predicted NBD/HSP70 family sugar kinase|uniref:ROK family protein n=1 Tax=Schleiferilactobacillus harbinensis TaxID=304207 RepID=A0A510U067_9LACO|nr:ROK family protein [Schleiferilactobacillus harbinensis]MBO3091142.1 ROK family protein [Schleiferilactobacillus harbinensis]QEU48556.1 ROK family protein [Schleiferilactobacillus harbinensis]QFR22401.1 ROK family protein [Schleiferilactobacillus harbinensis]GEK06571.1 GntR family transcriptional regulator [Schleiferilactobacillus harbinensis]